MIKYLLAAAFIAGLALGGFTFHAFYQFKGWLIEKKQDNAVEVSIEEYQKSEKENRELTKKLEELKNENRRPDCTLSSSDVKRLR